MLPLYLVFTSLWCHFYHLVCKLAYFVEHNIGFQPSKCQCFRLSLPNLTEWGGKHPSLVLQQDEKPSGYRVKTLQRLGGGRGSKSLIKVGTDVQQLQNLGCTKFLQKINTQAKKASKPNGQSNFHEI